MTLLAQQWRVSKNTNICYIPMFVVHDEMLRQSNTTSRNQVVYSNNNL
jgi:hypothetical protein